MRSTLATVLILALSSSAFADVVIIAVNRTDEDGKTLPGTQYRLSIVMVYHPDRERRLIEMLKTQQLLEARPWGQWDLNERKEGEIVKYTVYVGATPGFRVFRMVTDTDVEKVYIVEGHASLAAMQAMSGDNFQIKSLGDRILYGPRVP